MSKGKQKSPRLGRGLSSMLHQPVEMAPVSRETSPAGADEPGAVDGRTEESVGVAYLAVGVLEANPYQPRTNFDPQSLAQLAESIKVAGVMQPLVVRAKQGEPGKYQIVAGERRWRAAGLAGLENVPCVIKELDEATVAEWALIENLQREDLNPFERGHAFQNLIDQFGLSHQQIAERVGVERSTVTNTLRLLNLDPDIQKLVKEGHLTAGHARALAGLDDPTLQIQFAKRVIARGWSVRQLEAALRGDRQKTPAGAANVNPPAASHLPDLEKQISQQLGTKVRIKPGRRKGSGALTIEFYSLDQFDALLGKLGVETE